MNIKKLFCKPPVVVDNEDGSKSVGISTWQCLFYDKETDKVMEDVINHNVRLKKKAFEEEVRRIVREELLKIKQAAPTPAPATKPAQPKADVKPAPAKKASRQRKTK